MATLYRIEAGLCEDRADPEAAALPAQFASLGLPRPERVRIARIYWFEAPLGRAEAAQLAGALFADPVTERFAIDAPVYASEEESSGAEAPHKLEIVFKPGVMDPVAGSIRKALRDRGLEAGHIATGRKYLLWGALDESTLRLAARRILANESIQEIHFDRPAPVHRIHGEVPFRLRTIQLAGKNEAELLELSKQGCLSLTAAEMRQIQSHFTALGRDPSDAELETLAQTWSEHCRHKTLKGAVRFTGPNGQQRHYRSLLKETIVRATEQLAHPACLSVFKDNAGVVAFDEQWAVTFKVETHNHPSAIEPYGGAGTGIGGCIRDTLGTGLGAKPIANTDVFCFGMPDLPFGQLPPGTLHPRRVMQGVVAGVRDYGNRMGIPTVNGAVHFDPRYVGNPLVFCGSVGLLPRNKIHKQAHPGDLIVVLGGRTGRDGIHGATFSSVELTSESETASSGAVQIGNAIEEKKLLDVLLQARDAGLYSCVTDCGAGGLSSAVGEMGEETGAEVHLEKVPLKYAGLTYTEIWISEAQERMVLAVPPEHWPALERLCAAEEAEATVIGRFTGDRMLRLFYAGQPVGELAMEFLHGGLPEVVREAAWNPPRAAAGRGRGSDLRIEVERTADGKAQLRLAGVLDGHTSERLTRLFEEIFQSRPRPITLDLRDIRYIASAGLGVLLWIATTAGERGFKIELRNPSPQVQTVLKHAGIGSFFSGSAGLSGQDAALSSKGLTAIRQVVAKQGLSGGEAGGAGRALRNLLAHPTLASKEWIVRQYDHEVQGRTVIKPLQGKHDDGPGDAAVLAPLLGGTRGITLSNGLCPQFTALDPREMAKLAVDEALRNAVAVGADPAQCFILDNFAWGNTAKPEQLGSLVLACEGAAEAALAFGTPFISGKDSLNNEYAVQGQTIAIPGTLLISALAIVPDIRKCVTMDLKRPGNRMFVVGETRAELGGSHYRLVRGGTETEGQPPRVNLDLAKRLYARLHQAIGQGLVAACHDCSEGGLAVAAAEMAMAGDLGIELFLEQIPAPEAAPPSAEELLFSESPSRFLVEVPEAHVDEFRSLWSGLPCREAGHVRAEPFVLFRLTEGAQAAEVLKEPVGELRSIWQGVFTKGASS